jgi:PTH1 family peptidyl-tRNA hydrolase
VIVFGLGNPTDEYLFTRHNLGFMVVDALALGFGWRFRPKAKTLVAQGKYRSQELWLVKPLSYMNRSGAAVSQVLSRRDDSFLVVVDDVDLEFPRIRLRKQGGTSGHNGLASIRDHLGTEEFPRLRIGVGPRPEGAELSDYVLAPFSRAELKELPFVIERAADTVLLAASQGIDTAMNQVNPQ